MSKVGTTPLTVTSSRVLVKCLLPIPYNFRLCWSRRFSPKGGIFPPGNTSVVPLNRVNVFLALNCHLGSLTVLAHTLCVCVC